MDPIRVYNLGERGVNVDQSPIHGLDGDLAKAQNAIHQPMGLQGGIQKRPGLVKFNDHVAAGTLLGGIGVPLVLKTTTIGGVILPGGGGDPQGPTDPPIGEGGGGTGTGGGAGSGAGGGGSQGTGGGSGSGGGGNPTPTTTGRFIYMGRAIRALAGVGIGSQFWKTHDPTSAGVVSAADTIPVAPALIPVDAVASLANAVIALDDDPWCELTGAPGKAAVINNVMHYASNNYTPGDGVTFLPIMSYNGVDAAVLAWLPPTIGGDAEAVSGGGAATIMDKVMSILAVGPLLFVSVASQRPGVGARGGRVFCIDTTTAVFVEVGNPDFAAFPNSSGHIPYSLCVHQGYLYCGTIDRLSASNGKVWKLQLPPDLAVPTPPGATKSPISTLTKRIWEIEHTLSQGHAVGFLTSYSGDLYAGSAFSTTQVVEKRDTLGVWTVDKSIAGPGAASGSFLSARPFTVSQGVTNLYCAIGYPTLAAGTMTTRVYERDGAGTWTLRYDVAHSAGAAGMPCAMFQENVVDSVLWVYGGDFTHNSNAPFLITSPDGVTWSDQSAALTTPAGLTGIATIGEIVL